MNQKGFETNTLIFLGAIGLLFLAGLFFASNLGFQGFPPQSIIGVSNILVDLGAGPEEVIQASLAANNNDLIWFIPRENIKNASQGEFAQVTRDVQVRVVREGAFCRVPLVERTKPTISGNVIYYESSGSYRRSVPILIGVERNYLGTDALGDFVGTAQLNACSSAQSTASCEAVDNYVEFTTEDLGKVRIENLGAFDGPNAERCPDAGELALVRIPSTGQLTVVDKDALLNRLDSGTFTNCLSGLFGDISGLLQCYEAFVTGKIQGLDALPMPDGHIGTKIQTPLNIDEFTYNLDAGSAVGLLTVNMNTKFVGAIVFQPPQIDPFISSAYTNPVSVGIGDKTKLTVLVGNNGDEGDVLVKPISQTGKSSISPAQATKSVGSDTVRYEFDATCLIEGEETLDVFVEGLGSAGKSVSGEVGFTCEPRSGGVCGDGLCQIGEALTCSQDCTVKSYSTCVEKTCRVVQGIGTNTCGLDSDCAFVGEPPVCLPLIQQLVYEGETIYGLDLGIIKLFPGDTVVIPNCSLNWGLIIIVLLAIALGLITYKVVFKK